MLRQKLLKAPARVLLLTFIISAGMTVAVSASTSRIALTPSHGSRQISASGSRTRQEQKIDYSLIEGVQRWGLNE